MLGTCLCLGLTAQGATIFVKADATGANNGTRWADAFNQVQPALNAAVSGDEVWVAAGTYVENITLKRVWLSTAASPAPRPTWASGTGQPTRRYSMATRPAA